VLRLGPAAEWLIWPIPAVLSPFAGVFYPVATLPRWMQVVSWLLPPSWVFEALRTLIAGGSPSWPSLGGAGLLALVDVILAGWVFARVYRYAVRTGLIARYSAESVS
jgi:ABC-2 type transport system permease protein